MERRCLYVIRSNDNRNNLFDNYSFSINRK
nr:MAG TPA: hypothetical protein [Caudoviricetes sp.]